jgi:hypothetical protein
VDLLVCTGAWPLEVDTDPIIGKPVLHPVSPVQRKRASPSLAAMSSGLRVGLGGQPSEYLEIVDVLLPPWSAVAQAGKLLLHGEHAGNAHGHYRRAIERPWLVTEGAWWE